MPVLKPFVYAAKWPSAGLGHTTYHAQVFAGKNKYVQEWNNPGDLCPAVELHLNVCIDVLLTVYLSGHMRVRLSGSTGCLWKAVWQASYSKPSHQAWIIKLLTSDGGDVESRPRGCGGALQSVLA